ncbi:hypothetical protein ABKN59_008077 [Abortiporus biennis]
MTNERLLPWCWASTFTVFIRFLTLGGGHCGGLSLIGKSIYFPTSSSVVHLEVETDIEVSWPSGDYNIQSFDGKVDDCLIPGRTCVPAHRKVALLSNISIYVHRLTLPVYG